MVLGEKLGTDGGRLCKKNKFMGREHLFKKNKHPATCKSGRALKLITF